MEANIFETHFREFKQIAKNNTKYTKQGKPILSPADSGFDENVWDDKDEAGCDKRIRPDNING